MEMDVQNICRICLDDVLQESLPLNLPVNESVTNLTLVDILNTYINLNISLYDNLPQTICLTCAEKLKYIFQFIEGALESDKILKKHLIDTHTDVENEATEETEDTLQSTEENSELFPEDKFIFENMFDSESDEINIKNGKQNIDDVENAEETEHIEDVQNKTETIAVMPDDEQYQNHSNENIDSSKEKKRRRTAVNGKKPPPRFLCSICGRTFHIKFYFTAHLLKHEGKKPFKCRVCEKGFNAWNSWKMHESTHVGVPREKYKCTFCSKAFVTARGYREHNIKHTGEGNYECEICGKKFTIYSLLRIHSRCHTGEKPFQCHICGNYFKRRNGLIYHKRIHTGEKPYACKVCGRPFSQMSSLNTHMSIHVGKNLQCSLCDKRFQRPSLLALHEQSHSGIKPFACDQCPKRYCRRTTLNNHLKYHEEKKFQCPECAKLFAVEAALIKHRKSHTVEETFKCSSCSIVFMKKMHYETHLKTVHEVVVD